MSERLCLVSSAKALKMQFQLNTCPAFLPRYNIAPRQLLFIIRANQQGVRNISPAEWGLLSCRDSLDNAKRWLHARVENLYKLSPLSPLIAQQRCLIPVTAFYVWPAKAGVKAPYAVYQPNYEIMALAGLYSQRLSNQGDSLTTCVLITRQAPQDKLSHTLQFPLIVKLSDYHDWLTPSRPNADLEYLLTQLTDTAWPTLSSHRVSTWVNTINHEGARCLAMIE